MRPEQKAQAMRILKIVLLVLVGWFVLTNFGAVLKIVGIAVLVGIALVMFGPKIKSFFSDKD